MIDATLSFIIWMNDYLWSEWTFLLLMGAGVVFTIWTRFIQYRALTHGVQVLRGIYDSPDDPGAINHFQALSAALSATVGLGNIGGVALAIGTGGPGALFWMWVVGFLGMAVKAVEVTLAMMYRNIDNPDDPHGGAMWVVHYVLGSRGGAWKPIARAIGVFFCITLLISTITGSCVFQAKNVADLGLHYFGMPPIGTGILLGVSAGLVILGGIKRIGNVAGRLAPFMCLLYVLSGLAVIASNIDRVPEMLRLVITCAFGEATAGGAFLGAGAGLAFSVGLRRALFSNEAGQGSAPIAHAAAKTNEPSREGVVGGLEPFIDTICICTITAMVILLTETWNRPPLGVMDGQVRLEHHEKETRLIAPTQTTALPPPPVHEPWNPGDKVYFVVQVPDASGEYTHQQLRGTVQAARGRDIPASLPIAWDSVPAGARFRTNGEGEEDVGVYRVLEGAVMTGLAFDREFPGLGKWLVTLSACLFALSTMISWSYYGEQGIIYIFGNWAALPYKIVFVLAAILAPVIVPGTRELEAVMDFGTGWMLWANIPIMLCLGYLAIGNLNGYFRRLAAGEFHPHKAPSIIDVVEGHDVEKH